MSDELNTVLDELQTMAGAITEIRGTSRGQPINGVPYTPYAAVFLAGGSSRPLTYGGKLDETHNVTLRVYWDTRNPGTNEENLEKMWHSIVAKYQGDYDLGGNVMYSDLDSYTCGYQELSGVIYRILDVTISFRMSVTTFSM